MELMKIQIRLNSIYGSVGISSVIFECTCNYSISQFHRLYLCCNKQRNCILYYMLFVCLFVESIIVVVN